MTQTKSLAAKLCSIMEACHNIPKNGYNSFHKYKYVMAADAAEYVRQFMVKEKVIALPHVIKADTQKTEKGYLTELIMGYTFINAENPAEREEVSMLGHGADSLDKSSYKANTGVHKYFLMQSFCLGGDDDPEKEEKTINRPQERPKAQSYNTSNAPIKTNTAPSWTGLEKVKGGKHAGKAWSDIPGDYLEWLRHNAKQADTKRYAELEVSRRDEAGQPDFEAINEEALKAAYPPGVDPRDDE